MKAKSRRRVLISSVAMLLVAMLALGTATFAWFTNNKTVTANGMKVKAASAVGLQITGRNGADGTWGSSYKFTGAGTENNVQTASELAPVSVNYTASNALSKLTAFAPDESGVSGKYASASDDEKAITKGWAARTIPAPAASNEAYTKNTWFATYEVGVRASSGSIDGVKMQLNYTAPENDTKHYADFIRVAVVDQSAATVDYTNDDAILVIGSETGATAVSAVSGTPAAPTITAQVTPSASGAEVSIGQVTTTAHYYTIVVWFEGEDTQCVDANQQAEGTVDIKFYYQ